MSLLSEAMEQFAIMEKKRIPDGYGGLITTYEEGATFDGAIVYNTSIEAKIGAVQGVTDLYTLTTSKSVNLEYHDIFKRQSDGKTFRVTTDGDDNKTPASASLDMRNVSAEEFVIV